MVQQTTTTNPNYTTSTASSCPNMLPCGVCRLLMMNCPRQTTWYTPTWQAPTPMFTASDAHGFTDEERDLYWKTIQKKSVATGVNINDMFKADDKSEGE